MKKTQKQFTTAPIKKLASSHTVLLQYFVVDLWNLPVYFYRRRKNNKSTTRSTIRMARFDIHLFTICLPVSEDIDFLACLLSSLPNNNKTKNMF